MIYVGKAHFTTQGIVFTGYAPLNTDKADPTPNVAAESAGAALMGVYGMVQANREKKAEAESTLKSMEDQYSRSAASLRGATLERIVTDAPGDVHYFSRSEIRSIAQQQTKGILKVETIYGDLDLPIDGSSPQAQALSAWWESFDRTDNHPILWTIQKACLYCRICFWNPSPSRTLESDGLLAFIAGTGEDADSARIVSQILAHALSPNQFWTVVDKVVESGASFSRDFSRSAAKVQRSNAKKALFVAMVAMPIGLGMCYGSVQLALQTRAEVRSGARQKGQSEGEALVCLILIAVGVISILVGLFKFYSVGTRYFRSRRYL